MRNDLGVVCDDCGHRNDSSKYGDDCTLCVEGVYRDVQLECDICGRAFGENAIERAGNDFAYARESEDYGDETFLLVDFLHSFAVPTAPQLTYMRSSPMQWNYGGDCHDWTEYYRCPCGETLHYECGT